MFDSSGLKRLTKDLLTCIKRFCHLTYLMFESVEECGTSACFCPTVRCAHGLAHDLYVSNANHDASLSLDLLFACYDRRPCLLFGGVVVLRFDDPGERFKRLRCAWVAGEHRGKLDRVVKC